MRTTPTTMKPQNSSTSQTGKDPGEHSKQRDKGWEGLRLWNTALECWLDDDAELTSVGDGMYLTATVHSYTQHGCFIIPFDIFAFQQVRQEGQVCHNNAMGLLYIIQLLHTQRGRPRYHHTAGLLGWFMYMLVWHVTTLSLPVGRTRCR